MKKILLIFLSCLCIYNTGISQKRPVGYLNAGGTLFIPWDPNSNALFFPAFTLAPGIRFFQDNNFALVVNFPLSAGITYKTDLFAGIDLPAMLSFNFASSAGNNRNAKIGFILAAGEAYTNVVNSYDNISGGKINTKFWGFRFNAGVSFKEENEIISSIILSYGTSFFSHKVGIIGIGLQLIMFNR